MKTYIELEAIGIVEKVMDKDKKQLLVYCKDFNVYEFKPQAKKFQLYANLK
jgi:hypothetical protein